MLKTWLFDRWNRCIRPDRIVTNADIAKAVDTNDAWMVARTGIRERRIACEDEFTSDLGAKAAERALLHAASGLFIGPTEAS